MKATETIQDLIEEAKLRMLWWALCVFLLTYFLSHTSSSMWMNLPLSIALLAALRILSNEVEFSWKSHKRVQVKSYLSHLEKKQLSPNDSRLYATPPPPRWKRKIDSPIVEAAANEFIDKIVKDFVIDLWYSEITPDKETPELIRAVIMDAIGEIAGRIKVLNLVDLLTRDMVDLIGDHIELFRRNQLAIGVDVMATLSTEERDDRLKYHLMSSKELHPALISPESEYKYLQRLIGGLLAVLLRPRESQCPLVRAIAREIVTCLVMQPVMNLASPGYINELIEFILLAVNDGTLTEVGNSQFSGGVHKGDTTPSNCSSLSSQKAEDYNARGKYQSIDLTLAKIEDHMDPRFDYDSFQPETVRPRPADWARMLEVATQRRTEVLMPENLENMWTKGRNYKKKENKNIKSGAELSAAKVAAKNNIVLPKETLSNSTIRAKGTEEKAQVQQEHQLSHDISTNEEKKLFVHFTQDLNKLLSFEGEKKASDLFGNENRNRLKRSNSTSALKIQPDKRLAAAGDSEGPIISEFYGPEFGRHGDNHQIKVSDIVLRNDGSHVPKLKCRVMGAYFEKLGSKSFAVYSIAVTDAENRTWFVKRRYRNFERLHRHLKDIPNYTLHLPPKRIFSSSTEDAFVHQRCIQLDKYLQDLLSIANVAEQHEVWDFLSASSKNYSFGKSSSVMRNLAVNVDDAVDDIVRQFKGVFSSSSPLDGSISSVNSRHLSWNADEMHSHLRQDTSETLNSLSDNEESHQEESDGLGEVGLSVQGKGWHSDNELDSKGFAPLVVKQDGGSGAVGSQTKKVSGVKSEKLNQVTLPTASSLGTYNSKLMEDPSGMPPEWTPPNVSVPLLNLVDKVFQLKKRGWLRRQVFWMSKQILQLIMEDAIDDWLLSQICWLRSEETVAQGIRWVQDVLWPNGIFFTRVEAAQNKGDDSLGAVPFQISQFGGMGAPKQGSFEEQLAATRRASEIKKMLFDGAPTALVSLIGNKQYKRCARDIFYFTQSTICVKQLAYAILELVIVSVFPELRDVVLDINEKMRASLPQ